MPIARGSLLGFMVLLAVDMENHKREKMTYAGSGVNIDAATEAKKRIRSSGRAILQLRACSPISAVSASLFRLDQHRYRGTRCSFRVATVSAPSSRSPS